MEEQKHNDESTSDFPEQRAAGSQQDEKPEEPEPFPRSLLRRSIARRFEYFEQECVIEHPHMERACDEILQAICSPGNGISLKRLGCMVVVIGPTRVGKTTLITLLEKQLLHRAKRRMKQDPGHIPYVTISIPGEERFDWIDYYKEVLAQLHDPFVNSRAASIRGRDLRKAMQNALIQRSPSAVIIDEAHHLTKAGSGSKLQSQLDQLKHFENETGVSHVMVGTYEMRPFRYANAQLACRSVDVHFPRYDATGETDRALFRSIVWAFQRQLPLEEEFPLYTEHWEYLYARSIGCIGLLKLHLNRALAIALQEGAKVLTKDHLVRAETSEDRLQLSLSTALAGENELAKRKGADERLLFDLGLRQPPQKELLVSSEEKASPAKGKGKHEYFKRLPGRDPIGPEEEEVPNADTESGEKAS